jgi:hypothetical protein
VRSGDKRDYVIPAVFLTADVLRQRYKFALAQNGIFYQFSDISKPRQGHLFVEPEMEKMSARANVFWLRASGGFHADVSADRNQIDDLIWPDWEFPVLQAPTGVYYDVLADCRGGCPFCDGLDLVAHSSR